MSTQNSVSDPLGIARELILRPSGLDDARLDRVFGEVLRHSVDFADVYRDLNPNEIWADREMPRRFTPKRSWIVGLLFGTAFSVSMKTTILALAVLAGGVGTIVFAHWSGRVQTRGKLSWKPFGLHAVAAINFPGAVKYGNVFFYENNCLQFPATTDLLAGYR